MAYRKRIFDGNDRLIHFLQRLVGMVLVGEVLENILPIFHGVGANGKSVTLETLHGVLGPDYAMTASTSLLMVDRMGRHPTERTDLYGKRLVADGVENARRAGIAVVLLVGDEPYYARFGFKRIGLSRISMPGPVDPARMLAAELKEGALAEYSGLVEAAPATA